MHPVRGQNATPLGVRLSEGLDRTASIIGGEDMKLLEVDEAANHIRELVDPNANIIWGSAFNPDLQGKIRVSVVATGIEQTASMAEEAARPFNMGSSRGPARPAMSAPAAEPLFERAQPAEPVAEAEPEPAMASAGDDDWDMPDLSGNETAAADPLELEPESGSAIGADDDTADGGADELLLDASRLIEEDAPVSGSGALPGRRRGLISSDDDTVGEGSGSDGGDAPAAAEPAAPVAARASAPAPKVGSGATLFERMANLSRGGRSASEDEDEEDDGPSISIPRFLGRQNNQ